MAESQRFRSRGSERTFEIPWTVRRRFYDVNNDLIYDQFQDKSYTDVIVSPQQYCLDTVGFRTRDNPLSLSRSTTSPARMLLTGTAEYAEYDGISRHDMSIDFRGASFADVIHPDDFPEDDIEFVTKAAAASSPSKAAIQGSVFLAELRELPSLLYSTGATMSKYGANEYLKFQYGWSPFVKDVRKIFDVVSRIEKRMNVLNRLRDGGVLRHNYDPPNDANNTKVRTASRSPNPWDGLQTGYGRIAYELNTTIKTRRWADIIWVAEPPDNLVDFGSDPNFETARNAVYGLQLDGPTLWHAMPWTWLIDWVHNTSDYIESQNNVVGAKFGRAVLMRQSEVRTTAVPVFFDQDSDFVIADQIPVMGTRSTVLKERLLDVEPGVVQTGDFASILGDDFKLSILGALGIQRLRR